MANEKYKKSHSRAKEKYYSESKYRSIHHRYQKWEDELILKKTMPDKEIADLLFVSVKGIHNRRARLKQIQIYKTQIW